MTTKSQFIALLNGQLEGAASLREIEGGLESHKSRLYHLGATPPRRATPADANARCPDAVFSELFAVMAARMTHRPLRRAVAGTTYLIDASGLRLDGRSLKVGALLDQGLRRQIAMSSTTPMPTGRSTPRSPRRGSTTLPLHRKCRSRPAPLCL